MRIPSVSVAIATYNGERFLKEQLESLSAQTLAPSEVVITDDGSADRTLEIAAAFKEAAPFQVKVTPNPVRLGWAKNFMCAASLCSSDLIAFCDQDDIWYPRKLELAVGALTHPEVLMFCHDAFVVADDRSIIAPMGQLPRAQTRIEPLATTPWLGALGFTQVFRRSLLQFAHLRALSIDHNSPENHMAHDQWFFFLASVLGTIIYHPEPLAEYRQHGSNSCGWHTIRPSTRLAGKLSRPDQAMLANLADVARGRLKVLEALEGLVDGLSRDRARAAAKAYARFANVLDLRARMYSDASFLRRVSGLGELIRAGAYGTSNPWKLSLGSLAKDIVLGCQVPHIRA